MRHLPLLIVIVLIAVGLVMPLALEGYRLFQLSQILIYAVAILGLNILTGFNGQLSLGHGAFYALGAYAVAILMVHGGLEWWLALPLAGAIGFATGFLFGFPALRLEGHYLALATFGLALAVPPLLKNDAVAPWTGGVQGLFVPRPDPPAALAENADAWWYLIVLAVTAVMFLLARNMLDSRAGRALTALRDNRAAAEAMGVRAAFYCSIAFGISALYTAIAGGMAALVVQFVSPDSFPLFLSINLLVGAVVGGVASIGGALVGAAFIVAVPNLASDISQSATGAIFGILLILFVYLLPGGATGLLGKIKSR